MTCVVVSHMLLGRAYCAALSRRFVPASPTIPGSGHSSSWGNSHPSNGPLPRAMSSPPTP